MKNKKTKRHPLASDNGIVTIRGIFAEESRYGIRFSNGVRRMILRRDKVVNIQDSRHVQVEEDYAKERGLV